MPLLAYLESAVKGITTKGNTPITAFNHQASPEANQVFVIRKKIDASTPDFHEKMTSQEVFGKWKLDLWHNPRSGPECNYLSIALTGAKIAWINLVMPDAQNPEFANVHEYEDIAFTFDSATYTKHKED
jgi:type VI secretion system Hcp family effector